MCTEVIRPIYEHDGILDRCSDCDHSACFLFDKRDHKWSVKCNVCYKQFNWHFSRVDAWVEWNKEQRKT